MAAQKRILLEDWQEIKPYNKTAKSDLYFLGISNEINDKIYEKEFHLPLQNFIREEGISLFCMFLTSYLEDIISGSEVWNSFIKKHKELYGKPLPFYETDKNYVEGEVNIQDVKFLVWYFINTVNKNILLNPHDPFIQSISEGLVGILETEYEYAPENDLLRETYQIEPTQDYYEVRRLLNNILTKTYLFFPDTGFALLRQEAEIMEAGRRVEATLDDNRDRFIHEACTSLLALSAKEWAVLILGKKHPVAKDVEKMWGAKSTVSGNEAFQLNVIMKSGQLVVSWVFQKDDKVYLISFEGDRKTLASVISYIEETWSLDEKGPTNNI